MKVIAITQARYGSTRLPGKVLKKINGKTILQIHLERAGLSANIDDLIVATTIEKEADEIADIATGLGHKIYRGSIENVLDRYYHAAEKENPDYVVRITSDCPLIDPQLMDKIINDCIDGDYDYCTNTLERTYPDGMDVEVIKFSALKKSWQEVKLASDMEHVTPYIRRNSIFENGTFFKSFNVAGTVDYSKYSLTLDTPTDFELLKNLIEAIGEDKSWLQYVEYVDSHPEFLTRLS